MVRLSSPLRRQPSHYRVSRILAAISVILILLYLHIKVSHRSPREQLKVSAEGVGHIPHKIWQILIGRFPTEQFSNAIASWPTQNQDFTYTLLSDDGLNDLARKQYANQPGILNPFLDLQVNILRVDLARYMVLEKEGGIYSDLDVTAVKPITQWIPEHVDPDKVRAIIGIEYDQGDRPPHIYTYEPLVFCQWTVAMAPGHPIAQRAVKYVIEKLHALAEKEQVAIPDLRPAIDDVINVTGPAVWTKAVMDTMSETTGTAVNHLNFTGLKQPSLVGDTLVVPINGFGAGQAHSNSWTGIGNAPETLVRHVWKASWKEPGSGVRACYGDQCDKGGIS